MATDEVKERALDEIRFLSLVEGLATQAMVAMGKIVNPATGKTELVLELARSTIDLLGMLESKTRGNLSDLERKTLEMHLTNLRLTYVEEIKRTPTPAGTEPGQDAGPGAPAGG